MMEPRIKEYKSLKAVGANVLVQLDGLVNITKTGILMPDNGNQACFGTVLSKGNKVTNDINIGDRVQFDKFSGLKVKVNNILCKIIDPDHIFAIIENEFNVVIE